MIYLGIDDTDSKLGMCTTYLAAVLAERLSGFGLADYPRLIRLNPNIKYKTRGNAALCLMLGAGPEAMDDVERIALAAIEEFARFEDENTNPGVILHAGEITGDLKEYALRVVRDVVEIEEAEALAKKHGMRVHKFKNGRGIVGALASIGLELYDFTYELLAYRKPENYEKPRWLDQESVYAMDAATYPDTWDNVDLANKVIVFSPHTPDPVLYGIRGNSPDVLRRAQAMLKTEPVERSIIFRTNQGTDMHLLCGTIADAQDDRSYVLKGTRNRGGARHRGRPCVLLHRRQRSRDQMCGLRAYEGFPQHREKPHPRRRGACLRQREGPDRQSRKAGGRPAGGGRPQGHACVPVVRPPHGIGRCRAGIPLPQVQDEGAGEWSRKSVSGR